MKSMRRRFVQRWGAGILVVGCAWLAGAAPAQAGSVDMVQVSDRFRVVAKKVLTQIVVARMKASCGEDARCLALVGALADLVPAVEAKDQAALEQAVRRLITQYTFYVGIEAAKLKLPLAGLAAEKGCQEAATGVGAHLAACVPELYLGRASACSSSKLVALAQACTSAEPLMAIVAHSAEVSGWQLAHGPRNVSDWILLAIDVEQALYDKRLSSPWANVALTALHELTTSKRSYFDQGMFVHDNVNARLAGLTGARDTALFSKRAAEFSRAVTACTPALAPTLAEWTTVSAQFAQAVRTGDSPAADVLAPLRSLQAATAGPDCGESDARLVRWLGNAANEALHMVSEIKAYRGIAFVAPLVGLVLDVVNGRDSAAVRKDALRWLVMAGYDRLTMPFDPPSCEAVAARLLGGDAVTLPNDTCRLARSTLGDFPPSLFAASPDGPLRFGQLVASLGNHQYVLANPSTATPSTAAQLLLRAGGAGDEDPEVLVMVARGDLEGAAARVLSQGSGKLLAAVRGRLGEDSRRVQQHFAVFEAVVEAAYGPLADLFSGGDRQAVLNNLANQAIKHVYEDEALNRTMLLVRVGLGATWSRYRDESTQLGLTLLDQFGLAYKWGGTHAWYAGAFAGGFLDALLRTQQDGENRNFWVAGATVGLTKISDTFPLGVEIHGGAALPFENLWSGKHGAMWGASLLVPIDLVFDD
jgi:hypothetical protein